METLNKSYKVNGKEVLNAKTDGKLLVYIADIADAVELGKVDEEFKPVPRVEGEKRIIKSFDLAHFVDRYNDGKLTCRLSYEDYRTNKNIQDVIGEWGLSSDAFWMLILYCYDYSEDWSMHLQKKEMYFGEFVGELAGKIREGIEDSAREDMSLTLNVNGKPFYTIYNEDVLNKLQQWLENELTEHKDFDWDHVDLKPGTSLNMHPLTIETGMKLYRNQPVDEVAQSGSTSVHIYKFASMLLDFLRNDATVCAKKSKRGGVSLNKKWFVARIILAVGLSRNKHFDDDTLKGFLRQYKDLKPEGDMSIYIGIPMPGSPNYTEENLKSVDLVDIWEQTGVPIPVKQSEAKQDI